MSEQTPEVFVHTPGMDCPCGPEEHPIGIGHHAELGRIEELHFDDEDDNVRLFPPLPNVGD